MLERVSQRPLQDTRSFAAGSRSIWKTSLGSEASAVRRCSTRRTCIGGFQSFRRV